jgi:hypothetical protein
MRGLEIFNLVCWGMAGVITLCSKTVSKLIYFLTWLVLMANLLTPVLEEVL